jgi:hypothetical protein
MDNVYDWMKHAIGDIWSYELVADSMLLREFRGGQLSDAVDWASMHRDEFEEIEIWQVSWRIYREEALARQLIYCQINGQLLVPISPIVIYPG